MSIWGLYKRATAMLVVERRQTVLVVLCGIALGIVPIAEQVLLARVVDALALGQGAFPIIGLWAVLGLIGIIAGVIVAVTADRLAHRRRLAALGQAFEHAIILPISYHAEKGSGAVVRTILAGTDALFWNWLSFLREQFVAFIGLLVLVPTAIYMNAQMALILAALAVVYVLANVYVARRTSTDQAAVERYHNNVYGRVGDVLGNVTVVQSYARFASEMQAMRTIMAELLAAQYPVLTWWGLLTVLTRIAATITVVAIYAVGALLVSQKKISVGEIVAFVGFAGLLIGKLDLLSGFAVRIFQYAPTLRSFFELLDATDGVREKPGAMTLGKVAGNVRYEDVTFRFKNSDQGVFDVSLDAPAGQTIALVGPTGAGKTTTLALLQRLRALDGGRITVDGHDITDVTLTSLRHNMAVVFQDAGLFNRSIAENIRIGRPEATRRRGRAGGEARRGARLHRQEARRLRFHHRRARRLAVGRRAPAPRHRPRHPQGCADPDPGRGHQRARRGDGGAHQAGARSAAVGAHHLHHRPPAVHRCQRRPHPGARWRACGRARHASASWWRTRACSPGWWPRAGSPSPCLPKSPKPSLRKASSPLPVLHGERVGVEGRQQPPAVTCAPAWPARRRPWPGRSRCA